MEEVIVNPDNSELTKQDGMIQDHQLHEGKQFKKHLSQHRIKSEDLAQKLGVTRQAIYLQTKRQYLSTRFKKKLSALGMYPFAVDHNPPPQEKRLTGSTTEQTLLQEVKRLQMIIVLQAEHIREMAKLY